MGLFDWLNWWGVRLLGQVLVCLLVGAWVAWRLERWPARSHLVAVLALAASLLAPLFCEVVRQCGLGLFAGPAPATLYRTLLEPSPSWVTFPDAVGYGFLAFWAVGASLLLCGLALSFQRGRLLVLNSTPLQEGPLLDAVRLAQKALGLWGPVELRCSPEVPSPLVWCWGQRPVLLVPDEAVESPEIDWESVFIHELAHYRRGDHLSALFVDVVTALLFWCPIAWWLRAQSLRTSEFACDDWVVRAGKSSTQFSQALLSLRWDALVPRVSAPGLLGRRASLKDRVIRLLNLLAPPLGCGWGWALIAGALVLSFVSGLALIQASPRPHQDLLTVVRTN